MADALTLAIGLFAQAVSASPATTAPPAVNQQSAAEGDCAAPTPTANQREIVICAQRPNGYRLNPDVMEAKREKRSGGPPPPKSSIAVQTPCSVGPMPCQTAGINLVAAGITAVTMLERAAKGENVGDMFITDPHPTEYQLYQMAKQRREAREAEAAAIAKAKAAAAAAPANSQGKGQASPQ